MILQCCATYPQARKAALKSLDVIFASFPVLMCDSSLLVTMLECLTILRNACESEMDDEVSIGSTEGLAPVREVLIMTATVQCELRVQV